MTYVIDLMGIAYGYARFMNVKHVYFRTLAYSQPDSSAMRMASMRLRAPVLAMARER